MSNRLSPPPPRYQAKTDNAERAAERENRRSPWRQKLVDAERGFVLGFRRDSAFFGYLFGAVVATTAGAVLGLTLVEWAFLLASSTLVLVAEFLHQMVQSVLDEVCEKRPAQARKALRLGTAAVYTAIAGAAAMVVLILGRRILQEMNG